MIHNAKCRCNCRSQVQAVNVREWDAQGAWNEV
jgi:hypothetical protein